MKASADSVTPQFTSLARGPSPAVGPRALRTRARLIDTAGEFFLSKGYGATVIEDIADACGVSRATFYTYFESKHDLMVAMGENARRDGREAISRLAALSPRLPVKQLREWVSGYLDYLDVHGAFVVAWYQASWEDPELRREAMSTMGLGAQVLGRAINSLRGSAKHANPAVVGFIVLSMLERAWYYWTVMDAPATRDELVDGLTVALRGIIKGS